MNVRSSAAVRTSARFLSVAPVFLNAMHFASSNVKALVRALRNRRVAGKLDQLSDHELSDIGLTRDDLQFGKSMPFNADPTAELARRARRNSYR
ncbi:DUF1127 domain-containing protein [Hoeflea alexandrii]|uniref:DUF1127 domain-containing protein n=1 Tax=Hoeflea alexandrii TaxID=288436 RepID=UPI0022AE972F|nr:DUF1127 domain-containing protein [Hoeflea alexandrii]MCZ4290818.1 DUF1127 domain-containing protein [Hoeflea alexandrii]